MINCLIIDDSETGRRILQRKLEQLYTNFNLLQSCGTIAEARKILESHEFDLVFLDIKLENENGFDLLNYFPDRNFEIIFVTAHDQYALKAIQQEAAYYVLKPIEDEELVKGVNMVIGRIQESKRKVSRSIMIQSDSSSLRVYFSDIVYIQADGAYSHIHLLNKKIVTSKNIGYYEGLLPDETFVRTHNSFIVNVNHIKQISKSRSPEIILLNEKTIPVSQRKAPLLNQKLIKRQ